MKTKVKNYTDLNGKYYEMVIHWMVTDCCNFNCPGCSGHSMKDESALIPADIYIHALKIFLKNLKKTVKIVFTGGEPLLINNIIDVFDEITNKNYITLISNLTSNRVNELADRINPERICHIKASAHIMELEKYNLLDTFIKHYNLLQKKGFNIYTEEVAYPIMADKVDKYKKIFADCGIELKFQAFRGFWQNKKYPESYTENEYRIFNFEGFGTGSKAMHNRKNKMCNAGYNAVIAYKDGKLQPCFSIDTSLGNIYEAITLNNNLMKCPLDYCDCPLTIFDPQLFKKAIDETNIKG
jgi:MoaA/NifB/PqqE/SkfB family radical SAM enzyme